MATGNARKPKRKPTLERSIYFFRIDTESSGIKPQKVDLGPYVAQIRDLPFAPGSRRYWPEVNGDQIGIWTDDIHGLNDRFVLATVRRSALPRAELNGALTSLQLGVGGGLHEPIHLRTFDENIVGAEFNFYGPRPSRLSDYFRHALDGSTARFKLSPLLKQDALDSLDQQRKLRLLDLQVKSSYAAQLSEATHGKLGEVLRASAELPGVPVVGLTLRPEPHRHDFLGKSILKSVRKLAKDPELRSNAMHFVVKGENDETGKIDTLDLLQDKLVSRKQVVRADRNSRALDSESAYEAIGEAYGELQDELIAAASISQIGSNG